MRLKEVEAVERNMLLETIIAENDTGVAAEDLIKIIDAHKKNEWETFDNVEDFMKSLED